jgi:peptidoglycan/LPS O-acetylase OafA/YrhL
MTSYLGSGERSHVSAGLNDALVRGDRHVDRPVDRSVDRHVDRHVDRQPERPPGFRPDIEGLRAVAILLVVAYHVGIRWTPGGFVGVDVFFVISGFLITSHLVREVALTGRLSISRFYARRIMRLIPAAALTLAATLVAAWWWLPVTRLSPLVRDAVAADFYVLNYRLAELGTDYRTATSAPSAVQHFWSLGVEEQFYLVIPLLLILTMVAARRRGPFTVALAAITAASLWWSVTTTGSSPVWAYFAMPSRAWELGIGALLALSVVQWSSLPAPFALLLRWGGLAAIGFGAYQYDAGTVFPGRAALVPVLGAAAVIAGGCVNPDSLVLGSNPLTWIGGRSYAWYLWHWPVLVIAPFALSRDLGLTGHLVAALVALGLAAVSYHVVEHPLRDAPSFRESPGRAVKLGVGLMAGVALLALVMPWLPSRTPLGVDSVAEVSLGGGGSTATQALARELKAAARNHDLPKNLQPSLTDAPDDDPVIYRDGCHLDFEALRTPARCEKYGDPHGRTTLVLFGDSHAAQWFPAMQRIAKKRHARLAVFTKGACAAAAVKIYLPAVKAPYEQCVTWRENTLARISQLHPSLVVMSSNADGGHPLGVSGGDDRAWTTAWERTADRIDRAGTRVVYLNDTPWPTGNVPDCVAEHPRSVQTCAAPTQTAAGSPRRTMVAEALREDGVTVVDPMPWFCSVSTCPVVVGNTLVYKDDSHISVPYAELLAPLLGEKLTS